MVGLLKKKNAEPQNTEPILFTTEAIPHNFIIREMYQMIEVHDSILISKKNFFRSVFSRKRKKPYELLKTFASAAPAEANAILGVRTVTATASFSDGTYLMVTHSGTPAIIEKVGAGE